MKSKVIPETILQLEDSPSVHEIAQTYGLLYSQLDKFAKRDDVRNDGIKQAKLNLEQSYLWFKV